MDRNISEDVFRDRYFKKIKDSVNLAVVEKSQFAAFSSAIPDDVKIFSYEGRDDKIAYDHWVRRIDGELKYEPYVSETKHANLQLFDSLRRDLTGLGDRVYFFVDRDFDDIQGRVPHDKLFMTDRYSIENYLVCDKLLDELLKIEFHCNGYLAARTKIIDIFKIAYEKFLTVTKELNFRIFLAAREKIKRIEDLPMGINVIADVSLNGVTAIDRPIHEIVKLEREPTDEEAARWRGEFEALEPTERYRGKFALSFFVKWLTLLRQDRLANPSVCFGDVPLPDYGVKGNFSFDSLVPRAACPSGLSAFLGCG
ncbi:DUF4435 domain-containing protein [Burkholderia sp. RS02]|uniref:DUF4435 domain-containing protein n=1 Tax=unclassified Burkholderia TaxID=2613784 RepID=UPI003218DDDC